MRPGKSDRNPRRTAYQAAFILQVLILGMAFFKTSGQDMDYTRSVIRHLSSRELKGRGYVNHADLRAAKFIRNELKKAGVFPLTKDFFQSFRIDVNTFPGAMKLRMNDQTLVPGRDFLVDPSSPGISGNFIPVRLQASILLDAENNTALNNSRGRVVLVDSRELKPGQKEDKAEWHERISEIIFANPFGWKALVEISGDKLNFGASRRKAAITHIMVSANSYRDSIPDLEFRINSRFHTGYTTRNIAGFVPGTVCPDSFLVYTAHYDHLGTMGRNTYFPGANDNASGVALLLNLSRYFSLHPQRFSVAFICFSGEELGLLGSGYFTDNPLFSLLSVKFLINLDIVGTGSNGIMVVNATEFPRQFEKLSQINTKERFVADIRKRSSACNSDHCSFYRKGVPCFFIYTLGGISAYHDLYDRPETLPLNAFEGLMKLLVGFTGSF